VDEAGPGDPIDRSAIERLERLGGPDLVGRVAALFVELGRARMGAALDAVDAGDLASVERAAHSLKSSAGNVGARALAEVAGKVERLAEEGRGDAVPAAVAGMERELERALDALRPLAAGGGRGNRGGVRVRTIAHIEENADNRLLVRLILEEEYEVRDFATGLEALEALREDPPDLVLLDISLPGMDGIEILERMRADVRLEGVPVIAVTAHAMTGDREKYLAAGFDEYVAKPIVDEEVLLGSIRRLLADR